MLSWHESEQELKEKNAPAVIRPGSACSSRPELEELSLRRARAGLPPAVVAGAWLAGGDAAGVAGPARPGEPSSLNHI